MIHPVVYVGLKSGWQRPSRPLGYMDGEPIMDAIATSLGTSVAELHQRTRKRPIPELRAISCHVLHSMKFLSLGAISELVAGTRDHSSVLHRIRHLEDLMSVYPEIADRRDKALAAALAAAIRVTHKSAV